jgi:hypothetical protein
MYMNFSGWMAVRIFDLRNVVLKTIIVQIGRRDFREITDQRDGETERNIIIINIKD